jgi:outer membrane biosynthesis protein TonB
MRVGLGVSLTAHAAILLWGLASFASPRTLDAGATESIPIDIVSVAEFTELKRGQSRGEKKPEAVIEKRQPSPEKPREAPSASQAKPETVTAPPPPPAERLDPGRAMESKPEPARTAAAEPAPVRVPEPVRVIDTKPEVKPEQKSEVPPPPAPKPPAPKPAPKVAEARTELRPSEPRPSAPDRTFDPDRITALLDKAAPPKAAAPDVATAATASLGSLRGTAQRLSATEEDALRAHVQRCWNPPVADDPHSLVVPVRIYLNPDGSLSRPPEVVQAPGGSFGQVAAEAALRAVRRCEPLPLSPGMYDKLRQGFIFNFDPREMFGG